MVLNLHQMFNFIALIASAIGLQDVFHIDLEVLKRYTYLAQYGRKYIHYRELQPCDVVFYFQSSCTEENLYLPVVTLRYNPTLDVSDLFRCKVTELWIESWD